MSGEDLEVGIVISVADKASAGISKTDKQVDQLGRTIEKAGERARDATGRFTKAGDAAEQAGARAGARASMWTRLGRTIDDTSIKAQKFGTAYSKALDERTTRRADLLGLSLIAAGGASVWATARFEKQTSALQAFSSATTVEMQQMTSAAMDVALSQHAIGYTAGEAVQAQTELAKAGVSTANIIGGGLTGTLALAATEGMNVSDAATIASNSLNQFKLTGRDATRVADTLASGSAASSASVSSLGLSLGQAGLVANQTGLSFQDTVGALAAFAQNGMQGSDAGTSLRTMLMRLNPVSDAAAAYIKQYGLEAYDAQGRFVGLAAMAGKLHDNLSDLSTEQRAQVLQTIYGQDAIRAAGILYDLGSEGVTKWTAAVSKSGEAERMASQQTDNLYGDLNKLKAAIDGTLIKAGEGGNDALRSMTQEATSLVRGASALPAPLLEGAAAVTALTGATILAVPRIAAFREAAAGMGGVGKVIKGVGLGLGVGMLAVAATQAMGLKTEAEQALDRLRLIRRELNTPTGETSLSMSVRQIATDGRDLQAQFDSIGAQSPGQLWSSFTMGISQLWAGNYNPGDWYKANIEGSKEAQKQTATYTATLGDLAFKMGTTGAAASDILDKYVATGHSVDLLNGNYHEISDSVVRWTQTQYAGAKAADAASASTDRLTEAVQHQMTVLGEADAWSNQRKGVIAYQAAIDAAEASFKKNKVTANGKGGFAVGGAKGRANESALLAVVDQAKANYTTVDDEGGRSISDPEKYKAARREVVGLATDMLGREDAARAWAKEAFRVKDALGGIKKDRDAKPKTELIETGSVAGGAIDTVQRLQTISAWIDYLNGKVAVFGIRYNGPGNLPAGGPSGATSPSGAASPFGDTTYSHARSGSLGRTLGLHAKLAAGLPGMRITNALVGGGGLGYGSGDHQAGRALDVAGPSLGEYIRRVRAGGGFAEIHGTGPGRHAHAVPAGDTTTSRARGNSGGGLTQITVPVSVVGTVSASQVVGLQSAIVGAVENWQRQRTERGTG